MRRNNLSKRPIVLDISFYQDNPDTARIVDFQKMKNAGVSGIIFRVGQATWEDKKVGEYWKNSSNKGFLRGGYWYYDNSTDPYVQARKCFSIMDKYEMSFELPLFADFEDKRTNLPFHGWKHWYNFIEELKRLMPKIKIGVYSGYYYWEENKPTGLNAFRQSYFAQYPFWIAQYPYEKHMDESYYTKPMIPPAWKNWVFWQVSDRGDGNFFGVESSRVDVNYFNGSYEDFINLYGFPGEIEIEEKPNPEVSEKIKVIAEKMEAFYGENKVIYKKEQG